MKDNLIMKALLLVLAITFSCKKSSKKDEEKSGEKYVDIIVQTEMTVNEMEFLGRYIPNDIVRYPDDGIYLGKGKVSRKGTATGQEITIDFGAGGVCTDGIFRSGKLVIAFNETNFDTMVWPQTLKIGEIEVKGNYSLGYVAGSNLLQLRFIGLNGKFIKGDQQIASFHVDRKSEFKQGANTPNDVTDDVFVRTELFSDLTLTIDSKTALLKIKGKGESSLNFSCSNRYYPTTGQLEINITGSEQRSFQLTYGTGACNSQPKIN